MARHDTHTAIYVRPWLVGLQVCAIQDGLTKTLKLKISPYLGQTVATLKGVANGTLLAQNPADLTPVPIPGAALLFGSGLAAVMGWKPWRRGRRGIPHDQSRIARE